MSSRNLHRTRCSSLDVWEYPPGEFAWRTDTSHSACVIAGRAQLDLADGRQLQLRPGDTIFLPSGMHARWIVHETLRTVSVSNT